MIKIRELAIFLGFFALSQSLLAAPTSQIIKIDGSKLQLTRWHQADFPESVTNIVLLSGPTDNWNSDSAWFARLAPKLAKTHPVYSIDRAGQLTGQTDATIGYAAFGRQLSQVFEQLKLKNIQFIAFASSNIALNTYFANQPKQKVASVIMIDPDVLTTFSMARYKKDAAPFKKNLDKYVTYIGEGKYNDRAKQKNAMDFAHLQSLSQQDPDTDWAYVERVFKQRLKIANLQNTFREIAHYDQDLQAAAKVGFPKQIPLTILDTDFENTYIDNTEKEVDKQGLLQWQQDAKRYYQQLTQSSIRGHYIHVPTREHLLPFSDPDSLLKLVNSTGSR